MDVPGWHASRRAAREGEDDLPPFRGPDGLFRPVEQVLPLDEGFIGGWNISSPPTPAPPTPPPKNGLNLGIPVGRPPPLSPHLLQSGYPFISVPTPSFPSTPHSLHPSVDGSEWSHLSAVERSQNLKKRRMSPYLQFMCGPLLRYDIMDEHGVWHGAALIVTADIGSIYEPPPTFKYSWDPSQPASLKQHDVNNGHLVDLGPHPADPMAQPFRSPADGEEFQGPNTQEQRVFGREIYVYSGRGGTYTFWRFIIRIPLADFEMRIQYSINDGMEMNFFVPGRGETMRLAAYSCNGFSAGVNPDDFRGPGFQSGYDPVWVDLLAKHTDRPFHLLVGGGDQLYCDGIIREPELQEWVNHPKSEEKKKYPLTQEILTAIDRFYFNHYCQSFRSGAFARANSSIPMLNMADDHDPDDLQRAPVFNAIGSRGYFFFLLFQCFINDDRPGAHSVKSVIIGGQGTYVPLRSHSFLTCIGPTSWLLMLDCRAERKLTQVCSEEEYTKVFQRLHALPFGVEHVIIQLGIPIAYPRMVFLETILSSRFNPFISLGRSGLGLKGLVNKFNADAELLDDLAERNWFIEQLQLFAHHKRIRISLLSGDVHCAAVGVLKTLNKGKRLSALSPASDHRYMLNVVTSAIVNKPPPNGVVTTVSKLSTKRHETMHDANTDEEMAPLFTKDPDGSKPKSLYIMPRRNWCSITLEQPSGSLLFDIRVEKEKGHGETVG
ncbi:hypothetical protein B0F90DRAFT_1809674 [Multifurca ochricompacta]|uniref:PhoD-like phosphatase domain-containing protein n=1 Tax=Multifurca ochricompacta TaxID=376703 RepID=A0AAD4M8E7_9AGAM|nr:hypothetical protein B0F90DRAFT_1809674 [Multifurca ochricompacta]